MTVKKTTKTTDRTLVFSEDEGHWKFNAEQSFGVTVERRYDSSIKSDIWGHPCNTRANVFTIHIKDMKNYKLVIDYFGHKGETSTFTSRGTNTK